MSVELLAANDRAVMFCNTLDRAFGPVFYGSDARDQAEDFLDWLADDARAYDEHALDRKHTEWAKAAFHPETGDFVPVATVDELPDERTFYAEP